MAKAKTKTKEPASNPIEENTFHPERYVCIRFPYLRLGGGVKFEAGHFKATTPEQVKRVENCESYGRDIKRVAKTRSEKTIEESAVEATLAELAKKRPGVRSGAVGSRSML